MSRLSIEFRYPFSLVGLWLSLPLLILGAGLIPLQPCAGQSGTWTATGSLNTARYAHTAALLIGKVLVAGGFGTTGGTLASTELYDPATGTWTATGSLDRARSAHTATLLTNDKVLVAGGIGTTGKTLASAELYAPASGTWTATGSLPTARQLHTATLLPNRKVLVAGGYDNGAYLASAELYDPASGTWTTTGSLSTARYTHTATLLPNGNVLVAGGEGSNGRLASAELYDPASGTWTATGSLATARFWHTATSLLNGKVLVAGGFDNSDESLASAELYDPASGIWTSTGSLTNARFIHTATLLPNGNVLVAGGYGSGLPTSAELYDPATGIWTATGSLVSGRVVHTATLLPNGKVLVAGGEDSGGVPLTSAELYLSDGDGGLTLVSAASVKGPFAIDLPLTGPSGVEDRSGGPNKKYTVVMTFDQNIISVGSASSTCGTVQSIVSDNSDAHNVTLNLVGVAHGCNGSTITITANGISDDQGDVLDSASVGLDLLLGDVNGDRVVNRSDTNEAQMHKGQKTDQQNFRDDVNADGHIKQSDIELIRQQNGTSLP